jgi:PAS domain S-box-containing protein
MKDDGSESSSDRQRGANGSRNTAAHGLVRQAAESGAATGVTGAVPRRWLAWPPICVLLITTAALWLAGPRTAYESAFVMLILNFVFATSISLFIACLVGRSFLVRGTPGLLLLGCGVGLWGAGGFVGAAIGRGDSNVTVTIHNICLGLSAMCQLAGAALSLRPRRTLHATGLWLAAGYAMTTGVVVLVTLSTLGGWLPKFFIPGQGGTPVRQFVIACAAGMFLLTGGLFRFANRRHLSAFAFWYSLALVMIALGLIGVMMESTQSELMSWVGRATQFLGGLYMLTAAIASERESRDWGIPLEEALSEARQRFEELFELAADGIVVHEAAGSASRGNFIQANRAICELLGYTPQEMHELSPRDIMTGARTRRGGQGSSDGLMRYEETLLAKNGRRIPTEISTRIFHDRGRPIVMSVIRDITERKRAEEALRESEARYRTLVDLAPDAVLVHQNGRIVYCNAAAVDLFGAATADQIRGRQVLDFVHPDDIEAVRMRIRTALEGDPSPVREFRNLRLDGTEVPVETTSAAVRWQGKPAVQAIVREITKHKRMEEELRESRETAVRQLGEIEAIYGNAPIALCVLDSDLRFVRVNEELAEINGIAADDHLGRPIRDVLPELAPQLEPIFRRVLATGEPVVDLELRGTTAAQPGVERDLLASCYPLRDGSRVVGINAVVQEITGRKRAEEKLRELAQRLTYHVDHSPLAVIEFGADMRLTRWSGEAERIFGWKAEEVLGKSMGDFCWIHPEDQPLVASAIAGLFETEQPRRLSINRNFRKDGSVVYCEWYNSALLDESGKMQSILSLVLDVTARKQAEERLADAKRLLDALMEYVPEGVMIADAPDGRIRLVSRYVHEMFGGLPEGTAADQIARRWKLYQKDGVTPIGDMDLPLMRAIRNGETVKDEELVQIDAAGRHLTLLCNASPIRSGSGAITGGVVTWRDITDRKKVVEQIERLYREAQQEIERRKELEFKLRRSNEDLQEFASVISHDLQSPMNGVISMAELLKEDCAEIVGTTADFHLSHITSSLERMRRMILDLLAYSRAAHDAEGEYGVIDLEKVLQQAEINLAERVQENHAVITHAALPRVAGNLSRLVQLFQNLIENAIKYRREEPPWIHISADQKREEWVLCVSDNGIGIDPKHAEGIFGIFKRLHGNEYEGTGIGLSICKKIVERHGGRIWVESKSGAGARFFLTFPKIQEAARSKRRAGVAEKRLSGLRVLLVDDFDTGRYLKARMLSKAGADVREANSGRRTMEIVAEESFDLALIDIHLPDMMGPELAAKLHAHLATASLPVIYTSARFPHAELPEGTSFLQEPIHEESLLTLVSKVLGPGARQADSGMTG